MLTAKDRMSRTEWLSLKPLSHVDPVAWKSLFFFVLIPLLSFSSWYCFRQDHILYQILSIPLLVLAMNYSYLLLHEATHNAISSSKILNDFVGHVCGVWIMLPYLSRKRSHLLHHTWTGHPKGDPANERMIQKFKVITPSEKEKLETTWKYWIPLLALNDRIGLWRMGLRERGSAKLSLRREYHAVLIYGVIYFAGYAAAMYAGVFSRFAVWYLIAIVVQLFIEELVNLPHHAETPLLKESDAALPYWQQDVVTHSCKKVKFLSHFVLLNFNFHVVHHFYPWAPWYKLPMLHKRISDKLPYLNDDLNSEVGWSLTNRRRPLLSIMGHYFDGEFEKIPVEN